MKTDFGGTDDLAYAMARDASGRFVLAGYAGTDLAVARYHGVTPAGTPGTQPQWVQQDANFNVTSIADSSGNVLERYRYTPYGERTVLNAAGSAPVAGNASAYGMQHGHQGGRADAATGLVHFRHREYSPTLGRWVQRDPIGFVDGGNLYELVRSRPGFYTDPSGLAAEPKTQPGGTAAISNPDPRLGDPSYYPDPGFPSNDPRAHDMNIKFPNAGNKCDKCKEGGKLNKLARVDPKFTPAGSGVGSRMDIDLQIDGFYQDLQIRWWTCLRQGTSGFIPGSNDFTNSRHKMTSSPYITRTIVAFLVCENGKLTPKYYRVGGMYHDRGRKGWEFTSSAPATEFFPEGGE